MRSLLALQAVPPIRRMARSSLVGDRWGCRGLTAWWCAHDGWRGRWCGGRAASGGRRRCDAGRCRRPCRGWFEPCCRGRGRAWRALVTGRGWGGRRRAVGLTRVASSGRCCGGLAEQAADGGAGVAAGQGATAQDFHAGHHGKGEGEQTGGQPDHQRGAPSRRSGQPDRCPRRLRRLPWETGTVRSLGACGLPSRQSTGRGQS